ncbi:hypothetical protein COLO4_28783 [Corchorus olitorius]|uniref:Transmembrane protein n=1 Tax=Corchorus olitorius TaxID=93759 RepID=A0A1R3HIB7_9ROSI|nr:hypothetical protein COLO4_28783 [Corchorus olitorius]
MVFKTMFSSTIFENFSLDFIMIHYIPSFVIILASIVLKLLKSLKSINSLSESKAGKVGKSVKSEAKTRMSMRKAMLRLLKILISLRRVKVAKSAVNDEGSNSSCHKTKRAPKKNYSKSSIVTQWE